MSKLNCSGLVAKKIDQTYRDIIFKGQVQTAKCDKSAPIFSGSQRNALAKMCLPKPIGPAVSNAAITVERWNPVTPWDAYETYHGNPFKKIRYSLISIGAVSYLSTRCISWLQMASLAIFSTVPNGSSHTYFISNKYSRNTKSSWNDWPHHTYHKILQKYWLMMILHYLQWVSTIPTGARFCPSRNIVSKQCQWWIYIICIANSAKPSWCRSLYWPN